MRKWNRQVALALIFSLVLCGAVANSTESSAKAKPKLNKKSLTLTAGKSAKLKVKNLSKKQKKKLKWSSSNTWVATVSSSGKVKAKNAGKAKITARAGSKKMKCTVTVKAKKTSSQNPVVTPAPVRTPAPVPSENPKSNVDSVSTDQLAANVSVKMEKYQKGVLFTVTNNNAQWIDTLTVNYNIKNSSGLSIETGSLFFEGLKPNGTQSKPIGLVAEDAATVDTSKSEVSKTASYYSYSTYTDQTASVDVKSEVNVEHDIVVTLKNNASTVVSGYCLVYFKDASGNVVDIDGYTSIYLQPNETQIGTAYAPVDYDEDFNTIPSYASYEVKYYAYSDIYNP